MAEAGDIYRNFQAKFPAPKEGDLRVWWIPQVPSKPFEWPVKSLEEAMLLTDALAAYDDFQFANRIKGDYANAGGVQQFGEGEWTDWYHPETGDDFDEYRRSQK